MDYWSLIGADLTGVRIESDKPISPESDNIKKLSSEISFKF